MPQSSVRVRLEITFLLLFLVFHIPVLSRDVSDVSEVCGRGCHTNQLNLDENVFDIACNDTCKVQHCQFGCQRWTNAVSSCQEACNDTSRVSGWVLYCVLGCNHALNIYIDMIRADVGIPSAPFLVADSLTNDSLTIEWNAAPYSNITYLIQWKYESLPGDWNYYDPEVPLTINRLRIRGLKAYTHYRFRVAWLLFPQLPPLLSYESVIISTLPYGVPSSKPTISNIIAVSATQISLSWEPPLFPNAPILSYALYLTEYPNGAITVKDISNSLSDSDINGGHFKLSISQHYMFTGLSPNTTYSVSVTTRNNFGEGPKDVRNVTTLALKDSRKNSAENESIVSELILATDKEVIRRDALMPFAGDVLFRLNDFSSSAIINGLAIHVQHEYIFVSDTSGAIRRISLKNNKQIKTILRDRSRKPSHLSVDWLNDKLYMIEETKIIRCDLNGEFAENAIIGFDNRPIDMKVDPYNGYLYWLISDDNDGGLYRVDLNQINGKMMNHNQALIIHKDASLSTFAVDYANYLIYLPITRESSIYSITIDGNDPTNIRHNSMRNDELEGIDNLVVHNQLFYFTKGTEVYREEYEPENKIYHHNPTDVEAKIVALRLMDDNSQPYPVPLNPVEDVQSVFLDQSAKIVWEKPDLWGGTGHGAWQNWSYEVSIEETLSHITVLKRGLTQTDCVADELNPNTEYTIRVRGYSIAGNGTWSLPFHGKTLKKINHRSRYPFALWATKEGVLKSDIIGGHIDHLLHKMNMNGSAVNDIAWYSDCIFLSSNNNIYVYNMTSHASLVKLPNITNALSIAIDWITPKLYWSSSMQKMIMRSNIDGSQSEPLPISTFAKEIAIDSINGYLYWETGYSVEFSRINGMEMSSYFKTDSIFLKHIMGLTLNFDVMSVFWLVRSFDSAILYKADMANGDYELSQIKQSIKKIGPLKKTHVHGPLAYFNDRLFWLYQQNTALISDIRGENLAVFTATGLNDMHLATLAIVDPSLQPFPNGYEMLSDIIVVPQDIQPNDIEVIGSWDNFTIHWKAVTNVNYGNVFYDLVLEDKYHTHTSITSDSKYLYPSSSQLKPYSRIKLAIRAFTFWASSIQTIKEIHSPMSIPTKPTFPRVFISHKKFPYTNTIENIDAEFRWSPPELTNGIISAYTVNVWSIQNDQKAMEVEHAQQVPELSKICLSNLKMNMTYYFQVQAITDAGEGPSSDIIEAQTLEEHSVPELIVTKSNSIKRIDVDSREEKLITSKVTLPNDVVYIKSENKTFWIEDDDVIKMAHLDGSNVTILHQLHSPGTAMTIDWIGRYLYWSEKDMNAQRSIIWTYDLSSKAKPIPFLNKNNVVIGSIEIDPFSSMLIWTEIYNMNKNGQGIMKTCDTTVGTVNLFFKQQRSGNKLKIGKSNCNCPANPMVRSAITIDRSNEENPELLWVNAKYNHVIASDLSGCHCRIVINSTYGLPPTSITADKNYIYWSNASLGNVYSVPKEGTIHDKMAQSINVYQKSSSKSPNLILSEAADGVRGIRAFGRNLQPFPNHECLVPLEYQGTAKLIDNTANSLKISISKIHRPSLCEKITLASILYTIYYGKIYDDGSHECGVSFRGCKKLETYNSTVTINGLEPFTNYTVLVSVKNYYTPNDQINLPGPAVILETAESKPSSPRNVIVKVKTPRTVLVIWNPPEKPNGDPIYYEVRYYSSNDINRQNAVHEKNLNTTRFGESYNMELSPLQPDTKYYIFVRAYSSDYMFYNDSEPVTTVTYKLPNEIKLQKRSSRSLTICWTSPISPSNESEIAQHTIQYMMVGEQQWHIIENYTLTLPSVNYNYTFSNLIPNMEYAFRLLLTYRSTTSLFKWPDREGKDNIHRFIFKTFSDAPDVPSAPIWEKLPHHVYKIQWSPVNGYGSMVYYQLEMRTVFKDEEELTNEKNWILVYNNTEPFWLINGLSSDEKYLFRVCASNEFGISSYNTTIDQFHYYPIQESTDNSDVNLMTVFAVVLGSFFFIIIILIFAFTVCKHQVEEKMKKALDDNRIIRRGSNDLELAQWPVLPGHPHQTNTLYTNSNEFDEDLLGIPHIPHDQIQINTFLGCGAFGEVYKGLWNQIESGESKNIKVAIKTLGKDASDQNKVDFLKEAKLMANFRHPHILKLLGLCLDINRNFLILELMEDGDLLKYLRKNRPRGAIPSPLTMDDLMSICVDVAKGCKYLEDIHFVHRDLAARNCLVSSSDRNTRVVKIGDFGLARDIYKSDYYRKDGEGLLPVRWMAPESLVDGVFTTKSDIWAFGVLLYEVLSLGQQPYHARSNAQVLTYVTSGGILERPLNCHDDLFALMKQCWSFHREDRPCFAQCLETLEDIRKRISSLSVAITSVHNQNYILNRGFDNPGYSEDERLNGGNSRKLRNSSSTSTSAQTCSTNITIESAPSVYRNNKYLTLVGDHEELTDADGYQIPISKSPLQRLTVSDQLMDTLTQIVLNSEENTRIPPIALARRKFFDQNNENNRTDNTQRCSPPPTYSQVFINNDTLIEMNGDSNSMNGYQKNDNYSHNVKSLMSHDTKNTPLVNDNVSHQHLCPSLCPSSSLESSNSSSTSSTPPTVAGALLKTHSPSSVSAPSRNMTEIKYYFDERGLTKKIHSLQSMDHRHLINNNICPDEDNNTDSEIVATNDKLINSHSPHNGLSFINSSYTNNNLYDPNNYRNKPSLIKRIGEIAIPSSDRDSESRSTLNFDTNTSWC